ncbi:guanylate cyclase soluble subunit beta-2-like isoform X3 [Halichondria panicea]
MDCDTLLFNFGYYTFSVYWRNSTHDTLLYCLGDSVQELIQNLNALHHHLSSRYDKMIAPAFTCNTVPEGLLVHYHSARPGLGEYVRGIITGLANHMYRLNVNVEMLEHETVSARATKHYYKFRITLNGVKDEITLSKLHGIKNKKVGVIRDIKKVKANFHIIKSKSEFETEPKINPITSTDVDWPVTPEIFESIAPYHLIFNSDLKILRMSVPFSRIIECQHITDHPKIGDLFDIEIPQVELTHGNILNESNALFILSVKHSTSYGVVSKRTLRPSFRGQMCPFSSSLDSPILFLASPAVNSFEQLEQMGLSIADIGKSSSLHVLLESNNDYTPQMDLSRQLEKAKNQLEMEKAAVEKARRHTDLILHRMLPVKVASVLKQNGYVAPMEFSQVSILFTAIADFQKICKETSSHQVVTMLNDLFTRFDNLLETYQVYKVETVADSYMMAAGFPDTAKKHAHAVTKMAFEMRREVKEMNSTYSYNIEILIGVHSGPVVTGVIGTKQPRYCLFGDTVNTASRMNSTGEPDRIHISQETFKHICDDSSYHFISRGKIFVKGLGLRATYFVEEDQNITVHTHDNDTLEVTSIDREDHQSEL